MSDQALLSELARVKAIFQLRSIETVLGLPHQPLPRTDAEEIARPRCGCGSDIARRVIIDHGTCGMVGCPYGGDL